MDLRPLPDVARKRGQSVKRVLTMLRAVPGAIHDPGKGRMKFVDIDALAKVDARNESSLVARVVELEVIKQDHELRLQDVEAKVA